MKVGPEKDLQLRPWAVTDLNMPPSRQSVSREGGEGELLTGNGGGLGRWEEDRYRQGWGGFREEAVSFLRLLCSPALTSGAPGSRGEYSWLAGKLLHRLQEAGANILGWPGRCSTGSRKQG